MGSTTGTWGLRMIKKAICNLTGIGLFVLAVAAAAAIPTAAVRCQAAEEKTEVRFAYFDLGDYYQVNDEGALDSLDSAYLDEISQYTDLKFTYVDCGTWENAISMLEQHEVDLVGTMQWTAEREEKYEICDSNYGYTVAELTARKDSGYIYEDYATMDGATVGCIEGYVIVDQLRELMAEKGLSFNVRIYSSQTDLENALDNGEIDIIASNSHAVRDDWILLEKFNYAPMYFASWKGNGGLTDAISEALVKIKLYEPEFDDKLTEKYYGKMTTSPYNKQEIDCINQNETYTIYFDPDTRPIAWYDNDSGAMEGVMTDVCGELEQKTGLSFGYLPQGEQGAENGENAVNYCVTDLSDETVKNNRNLTEPIAVVNFALYHRSGESYDAGKTYSIVCNDNRSALQKYLKTQYQGCSVTECESPEECLKLVNNGKADLAFINENVADSLIITDSLNDLSYIPTTSVDFGVALEFHGDEAALLTQIVNKGISLCDGSVLDHSLLKYALESKPNTDVIYYLSNHPPIAAIVIICILSLLTLFIVLFMYARIMKKDKLQTDEISRERADFFSRMSHDMRTPMNGILGLTSLSEDEYDVTELRDSMKKIGESGEYLLGLINDTLDYQKIETGRMELACETVSVGKLIQTSVQMIQETAKLKRITFKVDNVNADFGAYIRTDAMRVKQLLVNLLSNAVKYTQEGGSILLRIEVLDRKGTKVSTRITEEDNGIGMSTDFVKNRLFKPFAQEKNQTTSQFAGTGLGLSIAKQIVDLMGATINVDSKPGAGTKFVVNIEFETVDPDTVEKLNDEKEQSDPDRFTILGKKNVLLAEDNPLNAEITQRLLEKMGCSVVWAKNGQECVDTYSTSNEGSFDAVLMDIRMPVMDGIEAAKAIRAMDRTDAGTIPIVAMSANAYAEDVQKSLAAGMNRHLAKPVQPGSLYETLAILMKNRITLST